MTAVDRGYAPMLGVLLGLLAGCTASESAAHRERVSTLDRGVAAQLDDQIITMDEVRELSKARNLPVAQARAHLVFDALLATAAHERGLDRTPALLVQRRAVLARALIDQMKQESKAHAITDEEVAKHMCMSLGEYRQLLQQMSFISLVALDELWNVGGDKGDKVSLVDTLEDSRVKDPSKTYEIEEMKRILADAINRLPEREKIVISRDYSAGLTLRETGVAHGLMELPACQMDTKAVLRLKGRLNSAKGALEV